MTDAHYRVEVGDADYDLTVGPSIIRIGPGPYPSIDAVAATAIIEYRGSLARRVRDALPTQLGIKRIRRDEGGRIVQLEEGLPPVGRTEAANAIATQISAATAPTIRRAVAAALATRRPKKEKSR